MAVSYINQLPNELLAVVLSHLTAKDLAHCERVSKRWNMVAASDFAWMEIAKRFFLYPPKRSVKDIVQQCQKNTLYSQQQIVYKLNIFLNEVSLYTKKARFRCVIGKNSSYDLFEIFWRSRSMSANETLHNDYFIDDVQSCEMGSANRVHPTRPHVHIQRKNAPLNAPIGATIEIASGHFTAIIQAPKKYNLFLLELHVQKILIEKIQSVQRDFELKQRSTLQFSLNVASRYGL